MVEGVDDGDVGVDLDGLAVEDGRAITPLVDGGGGGTDEERITGDDFDELHAAVSGDDGVEFDAPFAVKLDGEKGIGGLDAIDKHGGLHNFTPANGRRFSVVRGRGFDVRADTDLGVTTKNTVA